MSGTSLKTNAVAIKEQATKTIASGVLTVDQLYVVVAAQAGAADDLDTITSDFTTTTINGTDYRLIVALIADSGDTITIKHGTGNIDLPDGNDVTLTDDKLYWFIYNGANWNIFGAGTSAGSTAASDVSMLKISAATYDDVQDWSNATQSGGVTSGGAITDNGDGTVTVAAGTGIIKSTDSDVGVNYFFDWAQDASVALVDDSENWIYIDYNAGSPVIASVVVLADLDLHTELVMGKVWRKGTTAHVMQVGQYIADYARKTCYAMFELFGFMQASGAVVSEVGVRNIASSAGVFYCAANRLTTAAKNTSVADTFSYWYSDGGAGWTEVAAQTAIDNTQYDDGDGVLGTLTNNRYGVHWVYILHSGPLHVQYGTGDYSLAQAEAAQPPTPPPMITSIGSLAAKIIIEKSAAAFTLIESAYSTTFAGTTVSDHGSLAGLSDDDHAQYLLLAGRSGGQTAIGGTDANDNLTLETTSNGTKGDYIFSEMTGAGILVNTAAGVVTGGNTVAHEYGGLEADVNAYSGLVAISGGATSEVDSKSELEAQIADVADFAEADGDVYTGVHDFGGATSVEIPNSAAPTVDAAGEIAVDTTVADYTGMIKYHDGVEELTVLALPTANLSTHDNAVISYDAAANELVMEAPAGGGLFSSYAIIRDEKTQNTSGGTFTSGAWRTRDLNTEVADPDAIVSISSNQFTLAAGTYFIRAVAPAYRVNQHQTRLWNVTDGSLLVLGKVLHGLSTVNVVSDSWAICRFTLAASKAIELQHRGTTTRATDGFGIAANFDTEVYSVVEIFKEA